MPGSLQLQVAACWDLRGQGTAGREATPPHHPTVRASQDKMHQRSCASQASKPNSPGQEAGRQAGRAEGQPLNRLFTPLYSLGTYWVAGGVLGQGGAVSRHGLCSQIQEVQTNSTQLTGSGQGAQGVYMGLGLPLQSPQPGNWQTRWQVWCPNKGGVKHLSLGTMGAHGRN